MAKRTKALRAISDGYHQAMTRLRRTSTADLVGRLKRLRRMDVAKLTDGAIENRVGRIMDGFAHKPMLLKTNATFRARKNEGKASFGQASELWYPPSSVARLGRFNAHGEAVFYSASSMASAIWEVVPTEGDIVTVLACGSRLEMADIICAQVGVHLYEGRPQPAEYPLADLRADVAFQRDLKDDVIDQKWRLVDDLLSEWATASADGFADLYRVTRTFGDIFRRISMVEGITYPSVATNLKAFNTVLSCEAADKHFFPAEAWEFEIVDWGAVEIVPSPLSSRLMPIRAIRRSKSIGPDGAIEWLDEMPDVMKEQASVMTRVSNARELLR